VGWRNQKHPSAVCVVVYNDDMSDGGVDGADGAADDGDEYIVVASDAGEVFTQELDGQQQATTPPSPDGVAEPDGGHGKKTSKPKTFSGEACTSTLPGPLNHHHRMLCSALMLCVERSKI